MSGGFYSTLKSAVGKVKTMIQNSINYEFLAATWTVKQAIFSKQLQLSHN